MGWSPVALVYSSTGCTGWISGEKSDRVDECQRGRVRENERKKETKKKAHFNIKNSIQGV